MIKYKRVDVQSHSLNPSVSTSWLLFVVVVVQVDMSRTFFKRFGSACWVYFLVAILLVTFDIGQPQDPDEPETTAAATIIGEEVCVF